MLDIYNLLGDPTLRRPAGRPAPARTGRDERRVGLDGAQAAHRAAGPGPRRRPGGAYEPPRILYREPLEAMAAVCAPTPPAKGNVAFCSQGPISS